MSRDSATEMGNRRRSNVVRGLLRQELNLDFNRTLHDGIKELINELINSRLKNASKFKDYFKQLDTDKYNFAEIFKENSDNNLSGLIAAVDKVNSQLKGEQTSESKPTSPGELSELCFQLLVEFAQRGVLLPALKKGQWEVMSSNEMKQSFKNMRANFQDQGIKASFIKKSFFSFFKRGNRTALTKIVDQLLNDILDEESRGNIIAVEAWKNLDNQIKNWISEKNNKSSNGVRSSRIVAMRFLQLYVEQRINLLEAQMKTHPRMPNRERQVPYLDMPRLEEEKSSLKIATFC